jgi:hypothetical protein
MNDLDCQGHQTEIISFVAADFFHDDVWGRYQLHPHH